MEGRSTRSRHPIPWLRRRFTNYCTCPEVEEARADSAALEDIFGVGGWREIGENTGAGIEVDLLRIFRILYIKSVQVTTISSFVIPPSHTRCN